MVNCPDCDTLIDHAWTMKKRYEFDNPKRVVIRLNKFALVHCPKCDEIYNVQAPELYP